MEHEQLINAVKALSVLTKQQPLGEVIEDAKSTASEEKRVKKNVIESLLSITADPKVWPAAILGSLVEENATYKEPAQVDTIIERTERYPNEFVMKLFPFTLFGKEGQVMLGVQLVQSEPEKVFRSSLFFESNEEGVKHFGDTWETSTFLIDRKLRPHEYELVERIIADEQSYNTLLEKFLSLFEGAASVAAPLISERLKVHAKVQGEISGRLAEARTLHNDLSRILAKKKK